MDRRTFLGGMAAAPLLVVGAHAAKAEIPTIIGDGVNDDGPGINAFLRGERADIRHSGVYVRADGVRVVSGLHIRTSEAIEVRNMDKIVIRGNYIERA